jgi:hypothetical protein
MHIRDFVKSFGIFFLIIIAVEIILCVVLGALLISGASTQYVTIGAMLIGIGAGFPIVSTLLTFMVNLDCADGAA